MRKYHLLTAAAMLGLAGLAAAFAQGKEGPFTAAQVDAGRAAYAANCAGCHRPDLTGSGEQVPLTGPSFMAAWGRRSIKEFYDDIHAQMPYGKPGSLDPATYRTITAFVMAANGAKPGTTAFDGSATARIDSLAD